MGIQGIAKQERNPIVYVTGFVTVYTILYTLQVADDSTVLA